MRSEAMAEAVIGAKRMVLSDEEPEKIADFISLKLAMNNSTAASEIEA
jgi:hypothetical protein